MISQRVRDFLFDMVMVIGVVMALYATGCSQIRVAKHATYLCEPACEELSAVTVDRCYGLCSIAMAGSDAMEYIGICESGCREAVSLGEPQCVESCEAGVKAAIEAAR